jgi:hypothetical protein
MLSHAIGFKFVYPPVVCSAPNKTVRIRISEDTGNKIRSEIVALERITRASLYIGSILTEIYIM